MSWNEIVESEYFEFIRAAGIFCFWLFVALVSLLIFRVTAKRIESHRPGSLGSLALRSLCTWVVLFFILLGLFSSFRSTDYFAQWASNIDRAWNVSVILLITQAAFTTSRLVVTWYIDNVAPRTKNGFDDQILRLVRRLLRVFIYGIGILIILDAMGQSISPILGGLGITGLAVALALQPTLSNFFAGTYVLSDGAIRPGDYIELSGGPAGYVIEVGWRTTKLRTWWNTLVVVPNSVMTDTIITNYQGPDPAINVLVSSGVSYSSDLQKVEKISLGIANELIAESEDAVRTMDPWFSFDSFGDSNVNFWVFLQAKDRNGSFRITNELIKRLHARFEAEKIEINYPVRKLIFPEEFKGNIDAQSLG